MEIAFRTKPIKRAKTILALAAAAIASIVLGATSLHAANTFSVNFYASRGYFTAQETANLLVPSGVSAGLGDWFTNGWLNFEVPFGVGALPAVTLSSNQGSAAAFHFNDARNGSPYSDARTTFPGDGNYNMMDGHVNATLEGTGNKFDMQMTNIPFAYYDVIFYMGANLDQFGDGTGVIVFNGGAERAFKLKPGAFDGTFTEMVNGTTVGNYIVYKGVTGSSFTTQVWGTGSDGYNHVGPFGFQIRETQPGAADILGFTFPGLPATTIGIDTIGVTVPFATNVTALAPTFTMGPGATGNPSSGTTRNFATPQSYTITGPGAVTKNYTVTVTKIPASTVCDILSCNFGSLGNATITGNNITLLVPPGQPATALAPTFTFSPLATLSPVSGTVRDFSNPLTYRCTAQDGSTFKDYIVSVVSYTSWANSGSLWVLTTPNGANIPSGASESNFPLLVRLNGSNFNFSQAASDGRDIRFATPTNVALSYQIEEWDATNQTAAIWVKIPTITGNSSQEIKMYWGKPGVVSESNGSAVFNSANGFASALHLGSVLQDETGSVTPANVGSTASAGLIGMARNFVAGQGIDCGSNITSFPSGSQSHSTVLWIRPDAVGNLLSWGQYSPRSMVEMRLDGPPHIYVDAYFGGTINGITTFPLSQWTHVAYVYSGNQSKLYINGVLDSTTSATMNMSTTAQLYLGGHWGSYNYAGKLDEFKLSKVARSANWIRMEYENQKQQQTLVGSLVQTGSTFAATPASVNIDEGATALLTGQAGGAIKTYWIEKRGGVDTVLATDQLTYSVKAGRVAGNESYTIQFKAIYPATTQTVDIPVMVIEAIPDPVFTLTAPATWNGRDTIAVTANVSNLAAMQAAGAGNLTYKWTVNGVAVTKTITPGTLTLLRSQGSGPMTVTLTMNNGGSPVSNSTTITVQEPATDPWLERTPLANEKPVNNQFFARNPNTNLGTVYYNGTQSGSPDTVYLKVYKTLSGGSETLDATYRQALVGGAYTFSAPIAAGLITYRAVYGTTTGGTDTDVASVTNLICGDAFIIEGQSNALATDNAEPSAPAPSPWIRSYGKTLGWGNAVNKSSLSELQLGVWGMILAQRLVANNAMPVCIINGAVGGTRIDQHMANPTGHGTAGSLYSIYANLYNRVTGAKLTHGIRGVLWHQGEQDQGSGGPDGDYDYKFYQQYFVNMTAAWKQDFPNIQNYYLFQIWPAACGDTSRNDQLREAQRTLPFLYSNMRIMSTLGIVPGSSCHYEPAGYQMFSDLIGPLIEQDVYDSFPASVFAAANLKKAWFTTAAHNEIALEFDQSMWNNGSKSLYFLDGVAANATSSTASGNVIKLSLPVTSSAKEITYLKGVDWDGIQPNLVYGSNGIAALTFADVAIGSPPTPYEAWSASPVQGLTAGVNDGVLADPDGDGIVNLMEFALGGAPMISSQTILPKLAKTGNSWVFEYDRNDLALPPAATQVVEYGSDLTGWTPVTIPAASAGAVTIIPGTPFDHVSVVIPDLGPQAFVRLKVSRP